MSLKHLRFIFWGLFFGCVVKFCAYANTPIEALPQYWVVLEMFFLFVVPAWLNLQVLKVDIVYKNIPPIAGFYFMLGFSLISYVTNEIVANFTGAPYMETFAVTVVLAFIGILATLAMEKLSKNQPESEPIVQATETIPEPSNQLMQKCWHCQADYHKHSLTCPHCGSSRR